MQSSSHASILDASNAVSSRPQALTATAVFEPEARNLDGPFVLWAYVLSGSGSALQPPPDPKDEELHEHQEGSHSCVAGDGKFRQAFGVASMGRLAHGTLQQVPAQPTCTCPLLSVCRTRCAFHFCLREGPHSWPSLAMHLQNAGQAGFSIQAGRWPDRRCSRDSWARRGPAWLVVLSKTMRLLQS